MNERIPLSIPFLNGKESVYVQDCFETNFVSTAGPYVNKFEKHMADFLGVDDTVAVMNGTSGIHLSLIDANVGYDDEVLAPNLTFIAPLNAIRYQGAQPILIDSSWKTLGMCPEKLRDFLENNTERTKEGLKNKKTSRIIKAVIPMHTLGNCVDMDPLIALAKEFELTVIEDASESLGANYKGRPSGTLGDYGCFSFNGNKIITSGGGGLVLAKASGAIKKIRHLSTTAKTDSLNFVHDEVGFNYRMVNVLAAIGLAQAEQLNSFIEIKKQNFYKYKELLTNVKGGSLFTPDENLGTNHWFYGFILDENLASYKNDIIKELISMGIEVRPIWELMEYLAPYRDCDKGDLTISREIQKRTINIPCSVNLTNEEIEKVSMGLKEVLSRYL